MSGWACDETHVGFCWYVLAEGEADLRRRFLSPSSGESDHPCPSTDAPSAGGLRQPRRPPLRRPTKWACPTVAVSSSWSTTGCYQATNQRPQPFDATWRADRGPWLRGAVAEPRFPATGPTGQQARPQKLGFHQPAEWEYRMGAALRLRTLRVHERRLSLGSGLCAPPRVSGVRGGHEDRVPVR